MKPAADDKTTKKTDDSAKGASVATDTTPPLAKHHQALMLRWSKLGRRRQVIYSVVVIVLLAIAVVGATALKYPVVGLFHKGSASFSVVDETTGKPLLGAEIIVAGKVGLTDKTGNVTISGLPLGKKTAIISKNSYRDVNLPVTLFINRVKVPAVKLHSTGVRVKFSLKDWVGEKALSGVEVKVGSTAAVTDASGAADLSIEPGKLAGATATLKKSGYNDVTLALGPASKTNVAEMVPSGKVYFLSNRGRTIDLYASNIDGSAASIVLAGNGNEDRETGILPSLSNPDLIAIVSSRAGTRDKYGSLIHDLYVFNGSTRQLSKVETNYEFTDYRAWSGDKLVYRGTTSDNHFAIKSYSPSSKQIAQLYTASGNYNGGLASLSILLSTDSKIFFSVGDDDTAKKGVYVMSLAGQSQQRLDGTDADASYRQSKNALILQDYNADGGQLWRSLNITNNQVTKLANGPAIQTNRAYADSPDGKTSVFVETRDGKSELYSVDSSGDNEKKISSLGDVNQFVEWYGKQYAVFSTHTKEDALYAVDVTTGAARKITDFYQGNGFTYGGGINPVYQ